MSSAITSSVLYSYSRSPRKRKFALAIGQRDGFKCQLCGACERKLEIDHKDGNPRNWIFENLRLLCKPCNLAERNRLDSQRTMSVKENQPGTESLHALVNYSLGGVESQVNDHCEVEFRAWISGQIKIQGPIEKKDALNAGAEYVGCSPATTRKYLDKMTSSMGKLAEFKEANTKKTLIVTRESLVFPTKTPEAVTA